MATSFIVGASCGAAAAAAYFLLVKKPPSGFLAAVCEAESRIGADNILTPGVAKKLLADTPGSLLIDVQDAGSTVVKGSISCSLGTLPFKASTDLAGFKDPEIADRAKDALIVVNCGLGGQAKLGAKLLLDYGFTNVKVIDGGCDAYLKEFPDDKPCTKKGG